MSVDVVLHALDSAYLLRTSERASTPDILMTSERARGLMQPPPAFNTFLQFALSQLVVADVQNGHCPIGTIVMGVHDAKMSK